ncbi:MAG: alkyl sulfatase dimerization domain-containing protein [Candidatus Hodarchaeota archaeon]
MIRRTTEGMSDWFGMFGSKTFGDDNCYFIAGMANTGVFNTEEGLVIFDLPIRQYAKKMFGQIRERTDKQVKYVIYSHGHFDHAFGFAPILKEIEEKSWIMPQVIAHENCIRRFEKYRMLTEYHNWINKMQFASVAGRSQENLVDAHDTLDPTIILKGNDATYDFELGNVHFELYHDKGETNDSIWLWVPEKETICTGDLMVSSFPNVGNPYKVQRYPKDWAIAMDKMLKQDAKYLVPGHGPLIEGKEKVKDVLSITSEAMHFVHDEVVKRLNEGKWFEQIYHEMLGIFPDKFKKHPILRPMYGCYRFAIHATYRLYHGWYNSGNPTDLFPSKTEDIAKEFLKINDGKSYFEHAENLYEQGKMQLALHILDIVLKGSEQNDKQLVYNALKLKFKILKHKSRQEPSFIAVNIIDNSAVQIKKEFKEIKEKLNSS